MESNTRVFFVTDSHEDNEELFETLGQARAHRNSMNSGTGRRIRVCIVRNAYRDGEGWNYDDEQNTFETIKTLEEE